MNIFESGGIHVDSARALTLNKPEAPDPLHTGDDAGAYKPDNVGSSTRSAGLMPSHADILAGVAYYDPKPPTSIPDVARSTDPQPPTTRSTIPGVAKPLHLPSPSGPTTVIPGVVADRGENAAKP